MKAFFEGGPLDGKEDLDVPDGQKIFEVYEASMPPQYVSAEEYFLPTVHHYSLVAEVAGLGGRYAYRGVR